MVKPVTPTSHQILSNVSRRLSHGTQQALTPAYYRLLERIGNPHQNLPPVFHVAGTNGKGSTCAFLRAILEASGHKVHVYTSPHLVRFHERIRIAGELITEEKLVELLEECGRYNEDGQVSEFEITTAVAYLAFARQSADFVILETGLGGRLDATNVVEKKLATLITRLSFDHRDYLGDTLEKIAREKAGIMRKDVPCFISAQVELESIDSVRRESHAVGAPLFIEGDDWQIRATDSGFSFHNKERKLDLPRPALIGAHQFHNAGLAIAALSVLPRPVTSKAICEGVQKVEWPARLQRLENGRLADFLGHKQELWLDGGHNDSAGEVLAEQAKNWSAEDGQNPRPLYLIYGMLTTKKPEEFLRHLARHVAAVRTVTIPDATGSVTAPALAEDVRMCGVDNVSPAESLQQALTELSLLSPQARILICGSLYLAGAVLKQNAGKDF